MYEITLITLALLLVIASVGSASAQNRKGLLDATAAPPVPIKVTITEKINSVEITTGVTGWDYNGWDTIFGYGFSGPVAGDVSGVFTLSMNCYPAYWKPGSDNTLSGGMWTMPIYGRLYRDSGDVYLGSLSGKVSGGRMLWSYAGAQVTMGVEVTGGTGAWNNATGKGEFTGEIVQRKAGSSLEGTLTLTYSLPR